MVDKYPHLKDYLAAQKDNSMVKRLIARFSP
jgi:hypothetical protein